MAPSNSLFKFLSISLLPFHIAGRRWPSPFSNLHGRGSEEIHPMLYYFDFFDPTYLSIHLINHYLFLVLILKFVKELLLVFKCPCLFYLILKNTFIKWMQISWIREMTVLFPIILLDASRMDDVLGKDQMLIILIILDNYLILSYVLIFFILLLLVE